MNIEQMALESTYFHTAVVKRYGEYEDEWGATNVGLYPVYKDLPCAVSQNVGPNTTQTESRNVIDYTVKLFCSPEHEILAGDKIIATFENGLTQEYDAGESIPYLYHQEVPLIREGEA